MLTEEKIVEMTDISKSFPGVQALKNCFFELRRGEVHALCGENGAGKSTLMKILSGVYAKDSGIIRIQGKEADIRSPMDAIKKGISIIHQELQLMPQLTAADNIFIGREPHGKIKGMLDRKEQEQMAQEVMGRMGIGLDTQRLVKDMSIAERYMVEIAKAVSYHSKVLIMDEPTSALTDTEIHELFRLMGELKSSGMGIVYISHRMDEIKQITDRITVMRDGEFIACRDTKEIEIGEIIQLMVGRTIFESKPELPRHPSKDVVLRAENINCGKRVVNCSFELYRGEILGFSGLVGAGRTELARAVFGADKRDSGEIYVNGQKVSIAQPCDAVKCGIAYLSEDRKNMGLALGLDVENNLALSAYENYRNSVGIVKNEKLRKDSEQMVKELSIRTPSVKQKVKNLSGGNQQKVVIGKWLLKNSQILIFDEPTRGIDVGAKSEIYKILNRLAGDGKSIIMISSELPEVMRLSHRIIVMCEGRITGELTSDEANQERIMQFAANQNADLIRG